MKFLQREFDFSPIEITGWLLTSGNSQAEDALVRSLKEIYDIAESENRDAVSLLDELVAIKKSAEILEIRNQNFGLLIERIVRTVFAEKLKNREYSFRVVPNWKGYDFS